MPIVTEALDPRVLPLAAAHAQDGRTAQQIADALNGAGLTVPREAGHPRAHRHSHGYALASSPGNPSVWDAAAAEELLAALDAAGGDVSVPVLKVA
jgi:hypothetical protein